MLSRVADSLYWMSRYFERAEHTARLIDVYMHGMLDLSHARTGERWKRMSQCLRIPDGTLTHYDAFNVAQYTAFNADNSDSIVNCIMTARENARQVREQISSEMWEQLNGLYLSVIHTGIDQIWDAHPHEFFWTIREGSHLFQGITDSTMSHGQGWQFIQVGRFIERASNTAALLGVYFNAMAQNQEQGGDVVAADEYLEWAGLLKCCTAFEAYCKVFTAEVRPTQISEFLLLNTEFPRSVAFAARTIQEALTAVAEATDTSKASRAHRIAGRLVASLSFTNVEEILTGGLQHYLTDIQDQCAQIHQAIRDAYIAYPAEAAFPSAL